MDIFGDLFRKKSDKKQEANNKRLSDIFNKFVGAELLMREAYWDLHTPMCDWEVDISVNVADKNDPAFVALSKTATDNGLTMRLTSNCDRGNRPYKSSHVRPHIERIDSSASERTEETHDSWVRYAKYRIKHFDMG